MNAFFNRGNDLASQVKAIVKQSFPAVSPSTLTLAITEPSVRGGGHEVTTKRAGSNKERFVWGISRMGSSSLVG